MAPCRSSKSYLVFFLNKEHEEDEVIEEEEKEEEEKAKRKIRTKKKYKMEEGQMDRRLNCGGSVEDNKYYGVIVNLQYLILALGGTGILVSHKLSFNHTHKTLLRLGVEGHCAFGQLLDAHGMVPLSRQHVLATTGLRFSLLSTNQNMNFRNKRS